MLYVKSIELENIRCFGTKQKIDFLKDDHVAQWTLILGDNGAGKTTLLKSIVAMLPSPRQFASRRAHTENEHQVSYITDWEKDWKLERNNKSGNPNIRIEIEEVEKPFKFNSNNPSMWLELEIDQDFDNFYRQNSKRNPTLNTLLFSPVYCFAYGANRKVGSVSLSGKNYDRVNETLFIEDSVLQNSEEFYLQLDYEFSKSRKGSLEINRVKDLLKKILPEGIKDIRASKKEQYQRRVEVETPFGWIDINELSMGYKTTVTWLMDFASKMMYYHANYDNPFEAPAILVIDEIDLHMHPSWQYGIMENLSNIFKNTQFIVTAHSPLIAQAALNSNIVLLKRKGNQVVVENDPEVIRTWRVDQILTSNLFGINAVRAKEVQKLLNTKNKLLAKGSLTGAEQETLDGINKALGEVAVYDSPYEKRAYSAIDKIVEILKRNDPNDQNT